MIILTAYDLIFSPFGDLCMQSIVRYCQHHSDAHWVKRDIPADYKRPMSWFKVRAILEALPFTDYVLWVDADALIVGNHDYRNLIKPATVNISKDENGVNHGVVAWRNCPEAYCALTRMDEMTQFYDHKWWEQAALMAIIDKLTVAYQPKHIWNHYPSDRDWPHQDAQVYHYPGMSHEERMTLMHKHAPPPCFP